MPLGIDVPPAESAHRARQRRNSRLPTLMERGLVWLRRDGAHAVHATHVMNAIRRASPAGNDWTSATPIIVSRVISDASCSSVIPSVPAGCPGTTS
jgi:hypothetical protein